MGCLVAGVGINDLGYGVATYEKCGEEIKQVLCPYYNRWKDVLRRTNPKYAQSTRANYVDSSICEDWVYASNFKSWMETQDWKGNHLDKDILVVGNKEYSPETCAFVPHYINTCLLLNNAIRADLPIGVRKASKYKELYRADTKGEGKSKVYLGTFTSAMGAHKAWQWRKSCDIESWVSKYAKEDCFRTDVADALMQRVWQLRLDNANGVETKSL